jgi:CTP:molybdopterin cytidylyltransferase MocA
MNSSTVGLIILAAGASTRMGTPKQLLPYRERSFIRHITEGCDRIRLPTHCSSSWGQMRNELSLKSANYPYKS